MRDIFFRGKGLETDIWFYGGFSKEYNKDGEDEFYIVDAPCLIPVKKETVGQFKRRIRRMLKLWGSNTFL